MAVLQLLEVRLKLHDPLKSSRGYGRHVEPAMQPRYVYIYIYVFCVLLDLYIYMYMWVAKAQDANGAWLAAIGAGELLDLDARLERKAPGRVKVDNYILLYIYIYISIFIIV